MPRLVVPMADLPSACRAFKTLQNAVARVATLRPAQRAVACGAARAESPKLSGDSEIPLRTIIRVACATLRPAVASGAGQCQVKKRESSNPNSLGGAESARLRRRRPPARRVVLGSKPRSMARFGSMGAVYRGARVRGQALGSARGCCSASGLRIKHRKIHPSVLSFVR